VASGSVGIEPAVPMVMGANIGTSVTNTIVALGHMTRDQEFQRAFAGATVHDFFNVMAVIVFLPLEVFTGFLHRAAQWGTDRLMGQEGLTFESPLKAAVEPMADGILHGVTGLIEKADEPEQVAGVLGHGVAASPVRSA